MKYGNGLILKETIMKLTHTNVSFAKSLVRIAAAAALIMAGNEWLVVAGACIAIAEFLGIVEEIV
jgi:hypothetical protein